MTLPHKGYIKSRFFDFDRRYYKANERFLKNSARCPLCANSGHSLFRSTIGQIYSELRCTSKPLSGWLPGESSAEYYRIINREVRRRLGGVHSARSLMWSVDFGEIEHLQHQEVGHAYGKRGRRRSDPTQARRCRLCLDLCQYHASDGRCCCRSYQYPAASHSGSDRAENKGGGN